MKVIYLPGLGDNRRYLQNYILRLWRLFGVDARYHQIGWAEPGSFDSRLDAIVAEIDRLSGDGHEVALVGASAGAGAALNAYAARADKIMAVVFICGKVYGTNNINPRYFETNPIFKESIFMSDATLKRMTTKDKNKMLYVYADTDKTVLPKFNRIAGVRERKIFAFGHVSGIFFSVTCNARAICHFIKSRSKNSNGKVSG